MQNTAVESDAQFVMTPTKSYVDQENINPLTRNNSRYLSISKQISDRFNKQVKKPIRSMAALAIQRFNI